MNQVEVRTVENVPPDVLKFAPFNPPARTEKRALTKLRKEIEEVGRVISPLIVTEDNYVADGHRRLTVARELGFQTVPVIRERMNLAELWGRLNSGTLPATPKTWMQAVAAGMPLENVPDKERRQIEELHHIAGDKLFKELASKGRSPWIVEHAKLVSNYCDRHVNKFIRATILWFEEFAQQDASRRAMTEKCPPDVLISAIEEGRPIRQFWGIG